MVPEVGEAEPVARARPRRTGSTEKGIPEVNADPSINAPGQPAPRRRGAPRLALLAGAVALLALAVGCTPRTEVTVAGSAETARGIAVSGEGSVSVRPDIALVSLGVEVTADTVAAARGQAADAMEAIQSALGDQGVEDDDIQTQAFNIYPQYSYSEGEAPRIVAFIVQNAVQVKVRNLDNTSAVLDSAIEAGGDAVRVNGISFTVENPEEFLTDARREAVEDARARAQVLADAAGVELGDPISIQESSGGFPGGFPAFERAAADGMGGATPINPGEQELTVSVTAVFSIAD